MLRLTIWMTVPSFYQADLYRVLAASEGIDLQVVFARKISSDRVQLGWQNDLRGYAYHVLEGRSRIPNAVRLAWRGRNRVHIVNGIWAETPFAVAILILAMCGSVYTIYSEAPDPTVHRFLPKRLIQKAFGRIVIGKAKGFFPISHFAVQFYKSLGARKQAIYPFGYFRSKPKLRSQATLRSKNKIEVVFVGQLTHRKGVDLLLAAILPLLEKHPTLVLSLIGTGDQLEALGKQIVALDIKDRIFLEGAIPSDQIPARLANADLLVLPSRWDGWGLVVNEALSVGVPVVVSDLCGAADLIQQGVNGYVFRSEDMVALRSCLHAFLSRREEWPALRSAAQAVGERISIEQVAPYLVGCLQHMLGTLDGRPVPPWVEQGRP